jgi:hypothetical protein
MYCVETCVIPLARWSNFCRHPYAMITNFQGMRDFFEIIAHWVHMRHGNARMARR